MRKGFTLLAIACLVTDGEVHWDDRVDTFLDALCYTNVAYLAYHDLKLREVPSPRISSDTIAFSAGGIRSCMRDLLVFYGSLLRAIATSTRIEELSINVEELRTIFDASIPLKASKALREQSYGMGWGSTQLPNQVSEITSNSGILDTYPTIGGLVN
ncbi:hypothetical protein FOC1_g10005314 [Fusarium oxysporum f. sp. cubense race 1]|uniref:Uncharacterized protein n=1 Tax=Fusarium oxysporum f. sp. cubense (strain race 1) TaxID=1229664 RepID=N4TW89_FUSC1|nr:hypothetical protein FOC1_g10005314 [Fusarium oxysporum f. sp. cubense race 1]